MMSFRPLLLLLLLFTAFPPLCHGGEESPSPTSLVPVTLQLKWFHQFQFAGYYAAIDQGYYRDVGFAVTLKEGAPDVDPVDEVTSGRAQFGVTDPSILLRFSRGAEIQVLAAIFQHSPASMITLASAGIKSPADLPGKRVMLAGTVRAEFFAMCYREGVDPLTCRFSQPTWNIESLIKNQTDAFSGYVTNETYLLQQRNVPYHLITPRDYGIDFYGDCLFGAIAETPEEQAQAEAFRQASLQGWKYAMAHPEAMADLILKRYSQRKTRGHLLYEAEAMRQLMLPQLVEIGHMAIARWEHIADAYVQVKMLQADYSLKGFFFAPPAPTKRTWGWWVVSILLGVVLCAATGVALLAAFNRRLHRKVDQHTRELRKNERTLRSQEENLRITLDAIGDAVIATDDAAVITRMNPVAENLTGWSTGEAIGRPLETVFTTVSSESRDPNPSPAWETMQGKDQAGHPRQSILLRRDGSECTISDRAAPILTEEGQVIGSVLVFHDITEQLKLEEQFRQAQKMEAVGQLAGGIAHDFNNMLNGIIGGAEMILLKLGKDSPMNKYIDMILDAAEKATGLNKKLLSFSRKDQSISTPVELHACIENTLAIFERSIDRRIELNCQLEAKHCTIIGDPSQLQNAILNLCINARDAMPQGGTLHIETENVELSAEDCTSTNFSLTPGPHIFLTLIDTGTGMSREVQERIFEPFFTTKGEGKGTGLGMAAVYGCIQGHHGSLT
ncbi:MAG: ABC transporter substrate-binding protein, partial [Planctomycetota bacterium]